MFGIACGRCQRGRRNTAGVSVRRDGQAPEIPSTFPVTDGGLMRSRPSAAHWASRFAAVGLGTRVADDRVGRSVGGNREGASPDGVNVGNQVKNWPEETRDRGTQLNVCVRLLLVLDDRFPSGLGAGWFRETGGRVYQAAARGVQQEVEDIRSELVKLLRTLNSTNAGILGAEHELEQKVRTVGDLRTTPLLAPERYLRSGPEAGRGRRRVALLCRGWSRPRA